MRTKLLLLFLFTSTLLRAQTVDEVKQAIETSIINPTQARSLSNTTLGNIMRDMVEANADYTTTSFNSVGSSNLKGTIDTSVTPSSAPAGSWWFLKAYSTDSITYSHLSGIKLYKGETAIAIKNDTGYIKYLLPLSDLVNSSITSQNLINNTTFESVKQPVLGLIKTRFNYGNLSTYTTNYGTSSATRLIDSAFLYDGVVTTIQYYSTRAGAVTFKSFSKNVDGTYNVIAQITHTAVIGLNTIDSASLVNLKVVTGGTIGWYSSVSTGGGVGFLTGSTMSTKLLTGNVSGNNLSFGTNSLTSVWGIKATIQIKPTVAIESVVFPYGLLVPPIYDNQITYTGGADTLSNLFSTGTIVTDALVKSDGTVGGSAGWKYVNIAITDKQKKIFVSKINVRPGSVPNSGYYRFADAANVTLVFGGYTALSDTSYTIPTGATSFQIDIQDPTTTSTAYANAVISYRGSKAVKINGVDFAGISSGGGGASYNQTLNTYNDVQFNGLKANALMLVIPEGGSTPPDGVPIDGTWWDCTSGDCVLRKRKL